MGKSKKTETGGLSSNEAFKGLMKKMLIVLVVLLAALLDKAVAMSAGITFEAVAGATCLWFIASEGFSILENVAIMGVPVPKKMLQMLEIFRSKGDTPENKDSQKYIADSKKEEESSEGEKEKETEKEPGLSDQKDR